jgi:hypothetical protein
VGGEYRGRSPASQPASQPARHGVLVARYMYGVVVLYTDNDAAEAEGGSCDETDGAVAAGRGASRRAPLVPWFRRLCFHLPFTKGALAVSQLTAYIPPGWIPVSNMASSSRLTRCILAALDADCIDRVVTEVTCSSYGGKLVGGGSPESRWKESRRPGSLVLVPWFPGSLLAWLAVPWRLLDGDAW